MIDVEEGRALHIQLPSGVDHEFEQSALDLTAVGADQDIGDLFVEHLQAGLDDTDLAALDVYVDQVDARLGGGNFCQGNHRQGHIAAARHQFVRLFLARVKAGLQTPGLSSLFLGGEECRSRVSCSDPRDECPLAFSETVLGERLFRHLDVTAVALDPDHMDGSPGAPGDRAKIGHPAPPAAAEFDHGETRTAEVHGVEGSAPFG